MAKFPNSLLKVMFDVCALNNNICANHFLKLEKTYIRHVPILLKEMNRCDVYCSYLGFKTRKFSVVYHNHLHISYRKRGTFLS